ncbi:hypothetical protein ACFQFQ_14500 [Sulfitobacter porphyrae]|uniref:Uncharacterized protein n=1 Tax=Sulfitobacter porphyrae TaxID=1246864 RepID=A0ABW2B4V4_9RHOB
MTPLQIHWALVHYWSGDPRAEMGEHRYNHQGKAMLPWMRENGLLDLDGHKTDKLTAYVEHLCAVQLPVAKWVQPDDACLRSDKDT